MSSNHALAFAPFGSVTATTMFAADTLQDVGRHSSIWQIVADFLSASVGLAERIAEGPGGVLLLVGIPGKPGTGAFYLYQQTSRTFFSLDFQAQDTFSSSCFDHVVQLYSLDRLISSDETGETPVRGRHQRSVRHWYRSQVANKPAAAPHLHVHAASRSGIRA